MQTLLGALWGGAGGDGPPRRPAHRAAQGGRRRRRRRRCGAPGALRHRRRVRPRRVDAAPLTSDRRGGRPRRRPRRADRRQAPGLLLAELSALVGGARPDASARCRRCSPRSRRPPSVCLRRRPTRSAAACTATQLRLVSLLRSLVARRPPLHRDARSPRRVLRADADRGGAVVGWPRLCRAAGVARRLEELAVRGTRPTAAAAARARPHAEHLPSLLQTVVGGPVAQWKVDTSEWHLLQTLLRQCDGATAAAQLFYAAPPRHRPRPQARTAAAPHRALSGRPSALDAGLHGGAELKEWAPLVLDGMLLPNLVWRAGRAAEHVRLGSMLCLRSCCRCASSTRPSSASAPHRPPQPHQLPRRRRDRDAPLRASSSATPSTSSGRRGSTRRRCARSTPSSSSASTTRATGCASRAASRSPRCSPPPATRRRTPPAPT